MSERTIHEIRTHPPELGICQGFVADVLRRATRTPTEAGRRCGSYGELVASGHFTTRLD